MIIREFAGSEGGYRIDMDMQKMQQQMQQMTEGMNFPMSKNDMMSMAQQRGASNEMMDMIRRMPMDNFNSMDDVKSAMSNMMKMG